MRCVAGKKIKGRGGKKSKATQLYTPLMILKWPEMVLWDKCNFFNELLLMTEDEEPAEAREFLEKFSTWLDQMLTEAKSITKNLGEREKRVFEREEECKKREQNMSTLMEWMELGLEEEERKKFPERRTYCELLESNQHLIRQRVEEGRSLVYES